MRWVWSLAIVGFLFVPAQPAYAAGSVVYVNASVGMQTLNLKKGAAFVDKYTRTRFVYGKCRNGSRCITVRIDRGLTKGTAWASWNGNARERVLIRINPGRGSAYMSRLFAHEMAHGMFVGHSKYRTNLMWPTLHKANGSLVPWRFTTIQVRTLRMH